MTSTITVTNGIGVQAGRVAAYDQASVFSIAGINTAFNNLDVTGLLTTADGATALAPAATGTVTAGAVSLTFNTHTDAMAALMPSGRASEGAARLTVFVTSTAADCCVAPILITPAAAADAAVVESTETAIGLATAQALVDAHTSDTTAAHAASAISVAATPTNYAAATADVEAHLAGVDTALATAGSVPSDTKETPVDADKLTLWDSVASWAGKGLTWANLKTALGTGLATVFAALTHAARHKTGGDDALTAADIGALATGTLGATDNAIARANGTGAGTLQGSDLTIEDATTSTQANVALANAHAGQTTSALVLSPKGLGAIIFGQRPDGTVTGGNARGENSVDLQITRYAASQVCSGGQSTLLGGLRNTVSGGQANVIGGRSNTASGSYSSVLGGYSNTASATYSTAFGQSAVANLYGELAFSAVNFAGGRAQRLELQWTRVIATTDATELFLDGASVAAILLDSRTWTGLVVVGARQKAGKSGAAVYQVTIERSSNTTRLVGSVGTVIAWAADAEIGDAIVTIDANDVNESLRIVVTQANTTETSWMASLIGIELGVAP